MRYPQSLNYTSASCVAYSLMCLFCIAHNTEQIKQNNCLTISKSKHILRVIYHSRAHAHSTYRTCTFPLDSLLNPELLSIKWAQPRANTKGKHHAGGGKISTLVAQQAPSRAGFNRGWLCLYPLRTPLIPTSQAHLFHFWSTLTSLSKKPHLCVELTNPRLTQS
jgi:hypothetical protein